MRVLRACPRGPGGRCCGWQRCWPGRCWPRLSDGSLDPDTLQRIQALGEQAGAALAPGAVRVEIEPGRLDPRLRLAPCERIEPYLPPGARAWGRSRVGLRCVQGADTRGTCTCR